MEENLLIILLVLMISTGIILGSPVNQIESKLDIRRYPCGLVTETVNLTDSNLPQKCEHDNSLIYFQNYLESTKQQVVLFADNITKIWQLNVINKYSFLPEFSDQQSTNAICNRDVIKWQYDLQIYVGAFQTLTMHKSLTSVEINEDSQNLKMYARNVLCELQTLSLAFNQPIIYITDTELDKLINFESTTNIKLSAKLDTDKEYHINLMDYIITKGKFLKYLESISLSVSKNIRAEEE